MQSRYLILVQRFALIDRYNYMRGEQGFRLLLDLRRPGNRAATGEQFLNVRCDRVRRCRRRVPVDDLALTRDDELGLRARV